MSNQTSTPPGPLSRAFRAGAGGNAPADLDGERLEGLLERSVAAARRARPEIQLPPECVAAYAGERIRRGATAEQLEALRWDDLLLACACFRGDRASLAALEAIIAASARQAAQPYAIPELAAELRQELWSLLVVGAGRQERPQLLEYAGRGPLQAWLRMVAVRRAIKLGRGQTPAAEVCHSLADQPAAVDLELQYLQLEHRDHFVACFREAFASLEPRARTALRWHLVDGVGLDGIAQYYRVNRSSVTRWIARARGELVKRTCALMEQRHGLSRSEFSSLVRALKSKLGASISQLIPPAES